MILRTVRLYPYRWLLAAIALLIVLHAVILPVAPPGFYVDEAASGAHAIALAHHGTDAHGQAWPLFTPSLGGGYTTPVYLYPLAAWTVAFGPSELSLRTFSLCATLAACGFLGLAVRRLLSSTRIGLIATTVALSLPWGWVQGSLAWDPALVPFFVTLSLWMLAILLTTNHRRAYRAASVLLPLSLIALAYVYPPCRVTAPLLVLGYYGLLLWRQRIGWRHATVVAISGLILVTPLALFMIQPDALVRSQALSVFHGHSLISGLGLFSINLLSLINPLFLFITGDANLRHSTGLQGMLGLAAILPLGALVLAALRARRRRPIFNHPSATRLVLLVGIFGIAASLFGSALTSEGQPHSLRATAAWPFFALLITLGWQRILHADQLLRRVALTLAISSVALYVADLALLYPGRAADSFDSTARQAIMTHQHIDYPELALDYYRWR